MCRSNYDEGIGCSLCGTEIDHRTSESALDADATTQFTDFLLMPRRFRKTTERLDSVSYGDTLESGCSKIITIALYN